MRVVFGALLLLVSPIAGSAQDGELAKAVLQCAEVEAPDDRLACFDSLARAMPKSATAKAVASAPSATEESAPGLWRVQVTKEPLDDTTTVALGAYGQQHQAEMVLRCRQRRLDVLLSWNGRFLGASDPIIWTRIGAGKPEKMKWSLSSDHKAVLLQKDVKPFLRDLLAVDQFVVQLEHFAQGRMTDVFDVTKLKDSIAPLRSECQTE